MIKNIIINFQQHTTKLKFYQQIRNLTQTSLPKTPESTHAVESNELQHEHIEEAVKMTPLLEKVSSEMWQNSHKTFLNHGLSTHSFLQIVIRNPKVLMRSPRKVVDTLEFWRSCQFGEHFLFLLLTKHPFLMDVDDQMRLLKQITFLRSYVSTSKNVWKLLMNCPTLIIEAEESIEAKISYMKERMRIEIPEIVKSEALEKSLAHIKYRHMFTERLGLFKPRRLKADPNEKSSNPRLYRITDTSDKTFATKVCHVSLAEYEAFKELYARELDRIQDEEDWNVSNDLLSDEEQ